LARPEVVNKYVDDLHRFIDNNDLLARKTFIKSFIKEIKVFGEEGLIRYSLAVLPENQDEEGLGVLPTGRHWT
jgi:hypothetical protein